MISKEHNILFAAEKLFSEKGFDGTSTREIATAAKVNVSMISYYFGSKEKLLESLFETRMAEAQSYMTEIVARKDINEWQKISLIIDRYTDRVRELKVFYNIMQTEQLTNKNKTIVNFLKNSKLGYLKVYEDLAKKGFESKIFKKQPNIAFMHSTLIGTMFYAMNGLTLYKEYFHKTAEDISFDDDYYTELNIHIKQVLKNLLGYEEN
ncbi:TetR/AcrR family transcriptional regulator [Halpernia frigidisoli]|uniref:Transcriptional regulator, TetR family n=1 Tax=Halpernia frigidisoli TaxID=1125876 RepID=A0A1I3CS68_9FLAO|nr:TetR/AcrR family transcriptional regulator [Halpernia frigidisoli]SFH77382.1 transcriptional regulator, TetR family [Halpernia frigidisoli]